MKINVVTICKNLLKVLSFLKLEKIKYRTLYRVPTTYVLGSAVASQR